MLAPSQRLQVDTILGLPKAAFIGVAAGVVGLLGFLLLGGKKARAVHARRPFPFPARSTDACALHV